MITIYTTPTCAYCEQTKRYLTTRGARFEVKSATDDPNYAVIAKDYGFTVPLVTNGQITYVGWNLVKLNQMVEDE